MSKVIRRTWSGSGATGVPRRDRRPCSYEAYVPDPLAGRAIVLDGEVAADVADAEAALARLNHTASALADTEALARLLLRAEAVASSKIEGLEVGGRRLLRAEAARELQVEAHDVTAEEVLGNIEAMSWAVRSSGVASAITVEHVLEAHRRLMAGTRLSHEAGRIRGDQNWIGGSDYNPCSAAFVPPPPEYVPELLQDLCTFCNTDALPAVAQAAIAHAQFETIHPFVDGNGRIGRVLIHLILRKRGVAPRVLPPVSLILATWSQDYVAALNGTRYRGAADSAEAHEGLNRWIGLFAAACRRAIEDGEGFERRITQLQIDWRRRLGRVRAKSATDLLIEALPGAPILTVNSASHLISRTFPATNEAVTRLENAGVLSRTAVGRRNRAFEAIEAIEVIEAFTDLERRLASPAANTRWSPPERAVPRRPRRPPRNALSDR